MGACTSAKPARKNQGRRASLRNSQHYSASETSDKFLQLETFYAEKRRDMKKKLQLIYEEALAAKSHERSDLKLSFLSFEGKRIDHLVTILPFYQHVTRLTLWKCSIGAEGAKLMAPVLQTMVWLTMLGLEENSLGDEGVKYLVPALRRLEKLTELHLHINNIGDESMAALDPVLAQMPLLEILNLSENKLTAAGLRKLLDRLKESNPALKSLFLPANTLGSPSVPILLEVVPIFPSLVKLNLTKNEFTREDEDRLKGVLQRSNLLLII